MLSYINPDPLDSNLFSKVGSTLSELVDISGLSKAAVLAALFNSAAPGGMGLLQMSNGPFFMSEREAQQYIVQGSPDPGIPQAPLEFDYLLGRPLKVDISGDTFDPWGLDRDAGAGTAAAAIKRLRDTGQVTDPATAAHVIMQTKKNLNELLNPTT